MLETFTLEKFRCFSRLTIAPLARINLIAGKNNVGKTSLLEAICLNNGPTNPASHYFFDFLRFLKRFRIEDEESWAWLFLNQDRNMVAKLQATERDQSVRSLSIKMGEPEVVRMPETVTPKGTALDFAGKYELELLYGLEPARREKHFVTVTVSPLKTISSSRNAGIRFFACVFLGAAMLSSTDDPEQFSALQRVGKEEHVVEVLRTLDSRLSRLAVLASKGKSVIYGDLGVGPMVPMNLMGEGMRRLLSIILAIVSCEGGICLIDEIENGFHYSVLVDVWKAISQAARQSDVQIFATTHSWECIQAAHRAFSENGPYELRYHRLDRQDNEIVLKSFDERMLDRVQDTDLEIR